jgi:transposase
MCVCVCPVELFIQTGSVTETQRGFYREQSQQEAPSPNAIRQWVRQWREEGSVTCKKPPGRPSSVCAPDNIARVLVSVNRSPRQSARTQ